MPCPFSAVPVHTCSTAIHAHTPPSLQCQTLWCLLQRRWEWSATTGPTGGTCGQGGGPACSVSACCRPAWALLVQQSPAAPTDVVAKADPAVRMGWPPLKCRVGCVCWGVGGPPPLLHPARLTMAFRTPCSTPHPSPCAMACRGWDRRVWEASVRDALAGWEEAKEALGDPGSGVALSPRVVALVDASGAATSWGALQAHLADPGVRADSNVARYLFFGHKR